MMRIHVQTLREHDDDEGYDNSLNPSRLTTIMSSSMLLMKLKALYFPKINTG